MTVGELINKLSQYPQELPVFVYGGHYLKFDVDSVPSYYVDRLHSKYMLYISAMDEVFDDDVLDWLDDYIEKHEQDSCRSFDCEFWEQVYEAMRQYLSSDAYSQYLRSHRNDFDDEIES